MIHQQDLPKAPVASEVGNLCRILTDLSATGKQALIDGIVEQGRFARAADTAEHNQSVQGNVHVEIVQVMLADPLQAEKGGGVIHFAMMLR